MSDELDDVLNEFVIETNENLDQLDRDLVALEQEATADTLASVFRAIHTIKGTAGFFGFATLESVAHVGENLLSRLRDGELSVTERIVSALLATVDAIRDIMVAIEDAGAEAPADYTDLIAELERLARGEDADLIAEPERLARGEDAAEPVTVDRHDADPAPSGGPPCDAPPRDPTTASTSDGTPDGTSVPNHAAGESIRVDVGLLDDLMNLVGELVLARNQILQYTGTQTDSTFNATTQRLNLITTELQEGVMRTRMQPIENIWSKFPRVVRDLSLACGKQAALVMEGKHTELDKTLLEAIKDPLTHLVRNSVDHGLEAPDARVAAGKPAEGTVRLRAYHEGGQVIIEISDDGHGIDPAVIRRKAVEKGVLSSEEAAARSDREIVNVIFTPGFSTAAAVTNISGRGVGMDVVRTNIESIGGSVDVQSEVGEGTTFKVKIPLTLAIIPALIVTSGCDRYAIPQVSLVELVHADLSAGVGIEHVNGAPVFRLRDNLLPLVYLSEVLDAQPAGGDSLNIAVLQADDRRFGLVVDQITDTAEIVVKPLGRLLKHAVAFSGATIMGDGRVALILDVLGLAQRAEVGSAALHRAQLELIDQAPETTGGITEPMLLVGIGDRRFVLPLATVSRLEELPASSVRDAGDREVIHYRGEILPLVDLGRQLGVIAAPRGERLSVLVCSTAAGGLGLIVDEIHDIADQRLDLSDRTARAGIRGTTVIRDEVTDVLDLEALVAEHRFSMQGF